MADQVNMLAVPKQSVQLLQPDDKSKIMETAAMFENIYKMKVQEENNAYQQSLKQMKEQELAQELKRFEFGYDQHPSNRGHRVVCTGIRYRYQRRRQAAHSTQGTGDLRSNYRTMTDLS